MQAPILVCPNCQSPRVPGAETCPNCGVAYPPPFQSTNADAYNLPQSVSGNTTQGSAIAIIGVGLVLFAAVAGWIITSGVQQSRQSSLAQYSISNLRHLGIMMQEFAQDHDDNLPPMDSLASLETALKDYDINDPDHKLFIEPVTRKPYALNAGMSRLNLSLLTRPEETELAREPQMRQDGSVAVLYADGTVKLEHTGKYDAK